VIVTVSEEERQVIVLAMAELALRRPGWDWMLRNCAEESFSAGHMFDRFKETSDELAASTQGKPA
jgi:hypothetical protein